MVQRSANMPLSNFLVRSITAVIFATIVCLLCTVYVEYSVYLFLFLGIACLYEWARMTGDTWDRYLFSFGYLAAFLGGQYIIKTIVAHSYVHVFELTPYHLQVYGGIIASVVIADIGLSAILKRGKLKRILLQAFVGLCISYAFYVACYESVGAATYSLKNRLLLVFLIVWFTDTAAYISGSIVGGPKLAPKISPNKTWSGFIIGALASSIIMALLGYISEVYDSNIFKITVSTYVEALVIIAWVVVFSITAQIGDLIQSKLKRMYSVKDTGALLPGHGGFLDRLDSFITLVFLWGLLMLIINPYVTLIHWATN